LCHRRPPPSPVGASERGHERLEPIRVGGEAGWKFLKDLDATIMVTHDQDEAMEMADRIVVMNAGAIEQAGRPAELYQRPATRFVAEFIGRMNVLQLDDASGVIPSLDGVAIRLPAGAPDRVRRPRSPSSWNG
jgi:ABC-type sugar transport system ATPase subunit